jgi:hypothetical protein
MPASEYVFRATFARMNEIDSERAMVTAVVHDDNVPSIVAAGRVELYRTGAPGADGYWRMLGDADPRAGCQHS